MNSQSNPWPSSRASELGRGIAPAANFRGPAGEMNAAAVRSVPFLTDKMFAQIKANILRPIRTGTRTGVKIDHWPSDEHAAMKYAKHKGEFSASVSYDDYAKAARQMWAKPISATVKEVKTKDGNLMRIDLEKGEVSVATVWRNLWPLRPIITSYYKPSPMDTILTGQRQIDYVVRHYSSL